MCLSNEEAKRIIQSSRSILEFQDLNEDKLLAAVTLSWTTIKHIKKPSSAVRLAAIESDERSIKYLKSPTKEEIDFCVAKHPKSIRFFDQTEELQLIALNNCKNSSVRSVVVGHLKNPSYDLALRCVKSFGMNLGKVKNHTPEMIVAAIKNDPAAIKFVKDPLPEWQLHSVTKNPQVIQYIKNPTEEARLAAVKTDSMSIRWLKKTTWEEQKACMFKDEFCKELRYTNISTVPQILRYIRRPTAQLVDSLYEHALALDEEDNLTKLLMKWCSQYTRKPTVKLYIKMKYNF